MNRPEHVRRHSLFRLGCGIVLAGAKGWFTTEARNTRNCLRPVEIERQRISGHLLKIPCIPCFRGETECRGETKCRSGTLPKPASFLADFPSFIVRAGV